MPFDLALYHDAVTREVRLRASFRRPDGTVVERKGKRFLDVKSVDQTPVDERPPGYDYLAEAKATLGPDLFASLELAAAVVSPGAEKVRTVEVDEVRYEFSLHKQSQWVTALPLMIGGRGFKRRRFMALVHCSAMRGTCKGLADKELFLDRATVPATRDEILAFVLTDALKAELQAIALKSLEETEASETEDA